MTDIKHPSYTHDSPPKQDTFFRLPDLPVRSQEHRTIYRVNLTTNNKYRHGWININPNPETNPDLIWHGVTLPMFPDDSIDVIDASHFFNSLKREEMEAAKLEWERVLRPEGELILEGASFDGLICGQSIGSILDDLYTTNRAPDLNGKLRDLEHGGVTRQTGELLYSIIRELKPNQTLETGFAYGFSTLFILQALFDNQIGSHVAIDPVEKTRWNGIGLVNIHRAGLNHLFSFVEMSSQIALPQLHINGFQMEFALIDGSHLFDEVLVDWYYIDKMLVDGGIIVFEDWSSLPAVRTATSFVENNTHYQVIPTLSAPKVRVLRKTGKSQRSWDHFVKFGLRS